MVFSTQSMQSGYKEHNWDTPVNWKSAYEEKTRRLAWNGQQPGSCHLRVQSYTGGYEEKSLLQECGYEEKTFCVILGACNSVKLL
jgi:hypothetical protein